MIRRVSQKKLGKNKAGWTFDKRTDSWSTFEIDLRLQGERVRRRGFRTRREAEELEARLKAEARLGSFGLKPSVRFPLVSDLLDLRVESFPGRRERTFARRVFDTFLEVLGPGARIDQVAKAHYRAFADRRIGEGVSSGTANREITVLAAAFRHAGDYFPGLERFTPPAVYWPRVSKRSRGRVIRSGEREKLLQALLRPHETSEKPREYIARIRAGLLIRFALLSGLRHGEICGLRKSWLDRERMVLKVERPKTDSSGEIALSPGALEILDRAAAELYPSGPFFFSAQGRIHNGIYRLLKNAAAELGILYGRNTIDGLVVHDARHTFITTLQAAGFDLSTISSFSGHSDAHMVSRYTHATEKSRREASEAIAREMAADLPGLDDFEILAGLYDRTRRGEIELEDFLAEISAHFASVF